MGAYFLLRWAGPLAAPPVALVSLAAGGFLLLWGGFMALQAVDARRLLASLGLTQKKYILLTIKLGAPGVGLVHLVGAVCGLLLLRLDAGRIVHALGGRSNLTDITSIKTYLP